MSISVSGFVRRAEACLFVAAFLAGVPAMADTLIRIDFGGTRPATGYVETKAAATDAAFGSLGTNSWVGLTLSGSTLSGTDMAQTDGSASTVDLSLTSCSGSTGGAGDWRRDQANSNLAAVVGAGVSGASGVISLTGLIPNRTTKLWIYTVDRNNETRPSINIAGSGVTVGPQYGQDGSFGGGWSTYIRTDAAWNQAGGTPSWTSDADQNVLTPNNGFGYMITAKSDGSGAISGTFNFSGGENGTWSGMQIYQSSVADAVEPAGLRTLIRIDFGGTRPATGYVETKAAATDAGFGSKAPNNWVGLTLSGSTLSGTDMAQTDGSASTVDLSLTSCSSSTGGAGDWRRDQANSNLAAVVGDGVSGASGVISLTGLTPNKETKLWIYTVDRNNETRPSIAIAGSGVTVGPQYGQDGSFGGGWSTYIRTDAAWNQAGGTPSWTSDADQNVLTPNNGFGYMITARTDGSGTISGTFNFSGGENGTWGGMQIFQAGGEPPLGTVILIR